MDSTPFDLVFTALLDMVADSPRARKLVKTGNLIRYDSETTRNPYKNDVAVADLPEIILIAEGGLVSLHATSCDCSIVRRYSWLIATGEQRARYIHAAEFLLVCLLADCRTKLGALRWNEHSFVKRVDIVDVTTGLSDPARNRGIQGWSALWRCEVEMRFGITELIEYGRT